MDIIQIVVLCVLGAFALAIGYCLWHDKPPTK